MGKQSTTDRPPVPRNAKILRADGTEIPLELIYRGVWEGIHMWVNTNRFEHLEGDRIKIDLLPPHTAIGLQTVCNGHA